MKALVITNSITRRESKSIDKYMTEVSRYELLSPEQEVELFKAYKAGDEDALQKIINSNLRFVISVAKQYQNSGLSFEDLINEGNIGLIKAAKRFDETKGFKFISYAVWWIRQSILQAMNEKARKIRLPLNQHSNISKIMQIQEEFMREEEREPTMEELADATGFSPDMIRKAIKSNKKIISLDAPVMEDSYTPLSALVEDDSVDDPDHKLVVMESRQTEVDQLLKTLSPEEAKIISLYYGINRKYPMTLAEIGNQLGVSRERTRQIKDKILRKLKTRARLG